MSVSLSPLAGAGWQFFDSNGDPLTGGLIYTYSAGTLTPRVTYTTIAGNVQNQNPIELDADGRTPNEIWLTSLTSYKFQLNNSDDVPIGTYDNITGLIDENNVEEIAQDVINSTVLDTLPDLRSYNGESIVIFVNGANSPIDGGGGTYWFDSSDTTSADNGGTIIVGAANRRWKLVGVKDVFKLEDFESVQDALDAMGTNDTLIITDNNVSFDGVIFDKRVRIVGMGREEGIITGTLIFTNNSVGTVFQEILFNTPSTTYLFDITGRGGINFISCSLNAGTGNFIFNWDADGLSPLAIECMQCKIVGGKVLNCTSGAVTYEVHCKEATLVDLSENNQIVATGSNYGFLLFYDCLININSAVTILATTQRGLIKARNCDIDDGTSAVFLTNGSGVWDVIDVESNYSSSGSDRFTKISYYGGNGITGTGNPVQAGITTGTLTISANDNIPYYFITGDNTLVANTTYAISGGQFRNREIDVYFEGTQSTNGYTCTMFGIAFSAQQATIPPCWVKLIYTGSAWKAFIQGRSRFNVTDAGTQPHINDPSGGGTIDSQARTAINSILDLLEETKLMSA